MGSGHENLRRRLPPLGRPGPCRPVRAVHAAGSGLSSPLACKAFSAGAIRQKQQPRLGHRVSGVHALTLGPPGLAVPQ